MDRRAISVKSEVPVEYFSYQITNVDREAINYQVWEAVEKNELSVSVQGRLCQFGSHLCLESPELANTYLSNKLPQWRKKWGKSLEVAVVQWTSSDRKDFFRVLEHSDTIKRRLKIW